jgi:hypothetical protein
MRRRGPGWLSRGVKCVEILNASRDIQRRARLEAEAGSSGFAEKPTKTRHRGAQKCVWTLAVALHIRAALPIRANQVMENNMAKKTLKKSKKIEATKPLMTTKFGKH